MSLSPVMILGVKHPACRKEIEEISKKWKKRTKGLDSCWPEGGTFDVYVCKAMEVQIRDYKPKDKSKKRQQKREKELGIVKLFRDEGNQYRSADKSRCVTKETGIYPMISGAVEINEAGRMPIPVPTCLCTLLHLFSTLSIALDCCP